MNERRVGAYLMDLLIFILYGIFSITLTGEILRLLFENANLTLTVLWSLPLFLFGMLFYFGGISVLTRGSLGKELFEIKVVAVLGRITFIRLFIRDFILKYSWYFPLVIFIYKLLTSSRENIIFYAIICLISIGLPLGISLLYFKVKKRSLLDVLLNTKVEDSRKSEY